MKGWESNRRDVIYVRATEKVRVTRRWRDLRVEMQRAHVEGASVRVIADVVGLSPARMQALLDRNPDD
jgi:hypothetical protein